MYIFFKFPFKLSFILLKDILILHRKYIYSRKTEEYVYFYTVYITVIIIIKAHPKFNAGTV